MPRRRAPLLALVAVVLALAAAAPARAGFFVQPLDGPSADIQSLGGVDVARDATGAIVYVRRDGGVDHVFAARFFAGALRPARAPGPRPRRPLLPARGRGRGGGTRGGRLRERAAALYGVVRPAGATAWGPATALDGAGSISNPDIDMGI